MTVMTEETDDWLCGPPCWRPGGQPSAGAWRNVTLLTDC